MTQQNRIVLELKLVFLLLVGKTCLHVDIDKESFSDPVGAEAISNTETEPSVELETLCVIIPFIFLHLICLETSIC